MAEQEDKRITPRGDYQECLAHALTLAHILEHAAMFLPKDCELWRRSAVELSQFSAWINRKIGAESHLLAARQQWRSR